MSELLPDFIRQRIEQEIDAAIHPKGMSTHDGRTRIKAADAQRLLQVIDHLENAAMRETSPDSDLERAALRCEELAKAWGDDTPFAREKRHTYLSAAEQIRRLAPSPEIGPTGHGRKGESLEGAMPSPDHVAGAGNMVLIGYAVRMADGRFVGIWQDKAIAEHVCSKQPPSHGDAVLAVYTPTQAGAAAG